MVKLTSAQTRIVDDLRAWQGPAEFWPLVNDWVNDRGPQKSLALANINRTIAALIRLHVITIDDDGYVSLVSP